MFNYYPYQQPAYGQQYQPRQAYDVPFQDVRFVTPEEAKGYMVMPNAKVLLIDRQNKVATVKCADPMGQSTTQQFKFDVVGEQAQAQPVYVTMEQYNDLLAQIESLKKAMEDR